MFSSFSLFLGDWFWENFGICDTNYRNSYETIQVNVCTILDDHLSSYSGL